ncbi:SH3 domain-containing protein [Streptococcus ruminantium]|uniref:SH3 domain-containing protein n=1 Tax=Streptococcus ruminantium TaxID=1917441 RepID=UPI001D1373BC|nr:SH3 domain-containing protein [Streptococcus ruminantium]
MNSRLFTSSKTKRMTYCLMTTAFITSLSFQAPQQVFANARGDDYPYTAIDAVDPWKLYTRQCTSFAAFRLSTVNNFTLPPAYGNADTWGHRARQEGYTVDMNPAVGSIAWFEIPMHVAWVSAVNGDSVEIEEYNYGARYTYGRRTIPKHSASGYIHFKDLESANSSTISALPTATTLASSGTYTFTDQVAIKSQASSASSTIDYYFAGESVRYDQVIEAEGQQWISYISYSGARRYIAIETVTNTLTQQATVYSSLPPSGIYTIKTHSSVRNNPSLSSPEVAHYDTGASVYYDKVVTAEGRQWISYISYSGIRRYIAIS